MKDLSRESLVLTGVAAREPIAGIAPGTYLIVAESGRRFHEVMRTVPDEHTLFGGLNHNSWTVEGDTIVLPAIKLFENEAIKSELLPVPGGLCSFGTSEDDLAHPFEAWVNPYLLGAWEVGVSEYEDVLWKKLRRKRELNQVLRSPVGCLRIDEVLAFAEALGCRLPTELEYEFAATGGGTRPFPSGATPTPSPRKLASRVFSETGHATLDPRGGGSDIGKWGHFNLFSSVGELTWSHGINTLYQVDEIAKRRVGIREEWFSIRDYPSEIAGEPWALNGVRNRLNRSPEQVQEARFIGVRLARSVSPRWDWETPGIRSKASVRGPLDLSPESLTRHGIRPIDPN